MSVQDEILLLGTSQAAKRLRAQVERIARTPATTVFITGVPGMDARGAAQAIHRRSSAPENSFVAREAAEVSESDSIRPSSKNVAPFGAVPGGTLFLDEVQGLSPAAQKELLGWLDRPDSLGPRTRIIAASCVDLEESSAEGRFLADLLYRLNVLTLRLPPLRERLADLPAIAQSLLMRLRRRWSTSAHLTPEAALWLESHAWPGDFLELEASLTLVSLRAGNDAIGPELWAELGFRARGPGELVPVPSLGANASVHLKDDSLKANEEDMIRRVLSREGGNRSRAARALGIHRQTLYNKMRLYGID